MSLSAQILLSLGFGVAAGLFFGEWMAPLEVIGEVFVRLLQMTVLPYVVVSLMGGLGRLDYRDARRLGAWFLGLLSVMWVIAFGMVALMPLAFPTLSSASFFSTTLVEPAPSVDFVGLYVPTNPFHALANNLVPAVVLFSIAVGVALIGIREKTALLQALDTMGKALLRVSEFIVRLTPLGVFAISASAAGTMSVAEFGKVQVYLISYITLALISTFWILPGLISALTPLSAREVINISKDALVTAFATGSSFVVIPILAAHSKELLESRALSDGPGIGTGDGSGDGKVDSLVDVIIPASHNFPHTAKVLTLSFILFAGWFDDSPVPISDYPFLFVSGIAATFGSVNIAVPFLLDLMQLPHDLFQLFVATSVLNARFGTLLQAMHMLALTLLGTCALTGRLHFSLRKIVVYAAVSIALVVVGIGGARALFSVIVDTSFTKGQVLYSMQPILPTAEAVVHSSPPAPAALDPARSRLEQIQTRGSLRVCFRDSDSVPFSYVASNGELVGLDVEMAHSLARGLGVSLEFVPVQIGYDTRALGKPLSSGYCDIMMDRTAVTMDAIGQLVYSQPYLEITIGFLALDHRRREFSNLEEVVKREDLRLAVPNSRYFQQRFQRYLPNAELITVQNMREFLEDRGERFDAMIYAVEIGSAWSLLYPEYGVVVPRPSRGRVPMAFGLPLGEYEWKSAVDAWIDLKRADRTIDRLYDYWILGRETEQVQPRWSVIRDVLGWVD